jgi:hypothetical protein
LRHFDTIGDVSADKSMASLSMADEAVACVEALAPGSLSAALKKVCCSLTVQLFSLS